MIKALVEVKGTPMHLDLPKDEAMDASKDGKPKAKDTSGLQLGVENSNQSSKWELVSTQVQLRISLVQSGYL
jgi:hypothetical protein